MSIERTVINLTSSTNPVAELSDKEYEAKMIEILERGDIPDRLNVELPDDMHGEWVSNDPVSITRKKTLGFDIDTKHAAKNAMHNDGSGNPIIGDVIHMTIPRSRYEILERIKQKRYNEQHGIKDGKTPEERAYLAKNKSQGDVPNIDANTKTQVVDLRTVD